VRIVGVRPFGTAADFGLEVFDVIIAVNGRLIQNGPQLAFMMANYQGPISFLVQGRDGAFYQVDGILQFTEAVTVPGAPPAQPRARAINVSRRRVPPPFRRP
jgi:hypothetical protein